MKSLIHPFFVFTVALVMTAAFALSYCASHGIGGLDVSFTRVPLNLIYGLVGLIVLHTVTCAAESFAERIAAKARARIR